MKNKLLYIVVVFSFVVSYAQQGNIGVNTVNPKATLDIKAKTANTTNDVEGILIPRVSKNKAFLMGGNTSIESSMMIYVDDLSDYTTTPVAATVAEITEKGYYTWNGAKWAQISSQNGQEWKDGTNTNGDNLIYANQAKVVGNDIVITDNGRVGIGTDEPSEILEVTNPTAPNYIQSSSTTNKAGFSATSSAGDANVILSSKIKNATVNFISGEYNTPTAKYGYIGLDRDEDVLKIVRGNSFEGNNKGIIMNLTTGNVGIGDGLISPTEKLEVAGSIKIIDGTQGAGKVLTSDADGKASWKAPEAKVSLVSTQLGAGVTITNANKNQWLDTGTTITLPPGKWLVSGNLVFAIGMLNGVPNNGGVWIQATFCDSPTATDYSPDIIDGRLISGGMTWNTNFGMMVGSMVIHNQTNADKIYYLKTNGGTVLPNDATVGAFGGFANAENMIKAQRLE